MLKSFETDLGKVQDEYEECERTATENKKYKDEKLVELDEKHENSIDDLKIKHKEQV